jgi:hypothetical protein
LAAAHHQWFAQALAEPTVHATGYPQEAWAPAQQYQRCDWADLVDLWVSTNRMLVHVLGVIPEDRVKTPCRIGIEKPVPLETVVRRYVETCEDIMGQILSHL